MQFWVDNDIVTKKGVQHIEKVVARHQAPRSVVEYQQKFLQVLLGFQLISGEIGHLFTVIALQPILPSQHMQYWQLFVKACALLCLEINQTKNFGSPHLLEIVLYAICPSKWEVLFYTQYAFTLTFISMPSGLWPSVWVLVLFIAMPARILKFITFKQEYYHRIELALRSRMIYNTSTLRSSLRK